ncbi:DUF3127 domain-containing protein [Hymenobacter latericus]|uniref:DUF3127 domain-containing protein n=1 Tax=Hymenobacter sp. YIM 151858-1 TaxID=2987688 RepID=UPI002227D3BA|nr:DUF3127 domain-containing protein [Hymenobacter sp. YIM 151858-1]UYZ60113.1 DUF3127 domain-containing protein [Hymenobacter sp. YIM 151858-1]
MSDQVKITGTISHISDEQQITEKMRKKLVVITTEGTYPEVVAVEFINDKIDLTEGYKVGQTASAYVNIRGREWNGKYFVSLAGWKLEGAASQTGQRAGSAQPQRAVKQNDTNDLPF